MQSASPAGERRALGGELIIPGLAVAFTAYYFVSIHEAPWTAKVSTYFIGGVLVVLSLAFTAIVVRELRAGRASLSMRPVASPPDLRARRLTLLAITVAYVYLLEWGGFTLTTFVFLLAAMLVLGGTAVARTAAVLSAVYAVGGYLLFVAAFDTRFPAGPFERAMQALLD